MPVYNPKPEWLAEAIDSVRAQLYPHWELCIADDVSTDPSIRPLLERYAGMDPRIKVVFRESNGHISAASNSALSVATGDWVALLDHDDLLPEHALYCVATAIVENPSAKLFYSDEDKIDESGRRCDPYFKCGWNPDLFYSHNMFSHLGVYKKTLLDEIGGFRIGLEGSQDYDLALRCIERVDAATIHHIPRVLYHWRVHAASTASAAEAKPYAAVAGKRAIDEHLARKGIAGAVEYIGYGYRMHYALPDTLPLVSVIIPTRNAVDLMRQCIDSILHKTTYQNYEIIIVDNGSDDPESLKYFKSLEDSARIRVLRDDRPFNYSALNNAAVKQADGELVALVNNDIEVISPDWLSEMVAMAIQKDIGAVGAKLLYPNNTIQHAGLILGILGVAGNAHKHAPRSTHGYFGRASLINSFSAVTAACLVVRKSVYLEVGGFNEIDLSVAYNDVDFCLRVREVGYRNVWTPYAELYHHESATRGDENDPVKRARFMSETNYMKRRWAELLRDDPAYSPNLTLDHDNFSLAWPPRVEPLT
nr:glycosyltransferase family 2 protein [Burkholderia vietnamiensis]